jgi:two-component system, LuxR family, sensor kinase FixL
MRSGNATLPAIFGSPRAAVFSSHKVVVIAAYLAAYVALDWLSFVEPYPQIGVTPWNPNIGLSFVLVLLYGPRMIPWLFVSSLLAALVNRQTTLPWTAEILSAALIGGCYGAVLMYLKRPKVGFDPALSSMRDLALLISAAVAGAALIAPTYVGLATIAGVLPAKDFGAATLRYWVGDVIGILGFAPFALFALTGRRILPLSTETLLQVLSIAAALVLVFGAAEEREFQLFYVLFLPIIWMAVRTGTEGVSAGILLVQIGVIVGVRLFPEERQELTAFQILMLVLTVTGLAVGKLVSGRSRGCDCIKNHSRA